MLVWQAANSANRQFIVLKDKNAATKVPHAAELLCLAAWWDKLAQSTTPGDWKVLPPSSYRPLCLMYT